MATALAILIIAIVVAVIVLAMLAAIFIGANYEPVDAVPHDDEDRTSKIFWPCSRCRSTSKCTVLMKCAQS